ncbi:MAG TPA: bifunctional 5,10-methylenetetrahydrofolate dehydrogenase/5,10-methenyltetrahydrofolate cyclohydrolase [Phycisphaerales bacterium]|nr:bifunctional 5,10-methylenetetrahydrofolate dehydrogenase/5,10-methenyltetrahydrofolate cyclohydrolase [Phycisphaerales bacterium]
MTDAARILDGKALAQAHRARIAERASVLRSAGRPARLDAILCGATDNAARQYAESQARTCAELGIDHKLHELPATASQAEIAAKVVELNDDPTAGAIMVHMPLPEGVDAFAIQALIDQDKDVEGVNPANIGNIVYGRSSLAPCTALAVIKMVEHTGMELRGRTAVVVGASNHVGKPIAVLLMRQDATVVSCNKWTPDLPQLTARADILVSAAGVPGLISREMVKPGAVVIDVGVNRVRTVEGAMKTVGDCDFEPLRAPGGASWITPVPGGVGPMTVAMLLLNVVEAAERTAARRRRE